MVRLYGERRDRLKPLMLRPKEAHLPRMARRRLAPCGSAYTTTPSLVRSTSSNSIPLKCWLMSLISLLLLLVTKGPIALAEKAAECLLLSVVLVSPHEMDVLSELESPSNMAGGSGSGSGLGSQSSCRVVGFQVRFPCHVNMVFIAPVAARISASAKGRGRVAIEVNLLMVGLVMVLLQVAYAYANG